MSRVLPRRVAPVSSSGTLGGTFQSRGKACRSTEAPCFEEHGHQCPNKSSPTHVFARRKNCQFTLQETMKRKSGMCTWYPHDHTKIYDDSVEERRGLLGLLTIKMPRIIWGPILAKSPSTRCFNCGKSKFWFTNSIYTQIIEKSNSWGVSSWTLHEEDLPPVNKTAL